MAAITAALVDTYSNLDGDSVMAKAFDVLRAEPDLRGRSGLIVRSWRAELAQELRMRGVSDPVISEAVAGSAIGILTAAFEHQWTPRQLDDALTRCTPAGLRPSTPQAHNGPN